MDCQKDLNILLWEAYTAITLVNTRINGEPTTSQEWLIIGLQLRAAMRAANKVADALRKEEKNEPRRPA